MPKIMISDELKNHFCAKIYKHFYFLIYQIYNKNKKLSEIQRVLNVDPQGLQPCIKIDFIKTKLNIK